MNAVVLHAARRSLATQQFSNEHPLIITPAEAGGSSGIVSRRQFVGSATGALVAAATLGNGMWRAALAQSPGSSAPLPIPSGSPTPPLSGKFHVFAPAAFDPPTAEPATITNLNGFVGLAYISGMVTRHNRTTGEVVRRPFNGADMRFMTGLYAGVDGRIRRGTFALI